MESYDILPLRRIDDLAFHFVLKRMREILSAGKIRDFFSVCDFGYGNLFWFIQTIVTYPFAHFRMDSWAIFAARESSTIFLIAAIAIFWITFTAKRSLHFADGVFGLVLLTNSMAAFVALQFHNNSLVLFLLLSSFYFSEVSQNHRRKTWALVLCGLATGVKMNALLFAPIIFISLYGNELIEYRKLTYIVVRDVFRSLLIFAVATIFAISPVLRGWREIIRYVKISGKQAAAGSSSLWQNLELGFSTSLMHHLNMAIAVCLAIALWLHSSDDRNKRIKTLECLFSLFVIGLICFRIKTGPMYVAVYTLPAFYFLLYIFSETRAALKRWSAALAILVLYLNAGVIAEFIKQADLYGAIARTEETRTHMARFEKLEQMHLVQISDRIMIDYRLIYPLNVLRRTNDTIYLYDDLNFSSAEMFDVLILDKTSPVFTNSCEDMDKVHLGSGANCNVLKEIIATKKDYHVQFEDDRLIVLRSKSAAESI